MGKEYEPTADIYQTTVARDVVDAGADFVVANNPHWVQNAEVYNDKLILYSTGNFIFDQQWNDELKRSVSLDVGLQITEQESLQDWLDIGQRCAASPETCWQEILAMDLPKLSPKYEFAPIGGDNSSRLTVRADAAQQAAIEDRLNWQAVEAALSQ